MARPSIPVSEAFVRLTRELASAGYPALAIASGCGVSRSTFFRKLRAYKELKAAYTHQSNTHTPKDAA